MKKLIINKLMNYIKKYNNYSKTKLKEIEYGLSSLYLSTSKAIVIFLCAYFLGVFKESIIFLMFFNILRLFGFGLHATKSWICLLSSAIIFIGIPFVCIYLKLNIIIKILICIVGVIFMYKNAPADTKKRPIVNHKRRRIYKLLSTILAICFSFLSILIKNNFISNCLVFSIILEDIMISPIIYKIFKLPYNNYIEYLKKHPEIAN